MPKFTRFFFGWGFPERYDSEGLIGSSLDLGLVFFSESSHNIFVETAPLDFSDGARNRTSLQDIVPHLPVKNHLRLVLQDKIDVSVYNS